MGDPNFVKAISIHSTISLPVMPITPQFVAAIRTVVWKIVAMTLPYQKPVFTIVTIPENPRKI
jgi:hypothetical protein